MAENVSELKVGYILERLASESPHWGGGSAVLLGASMGACLLAMAARVTLAGVAQGTFELTTSTVEQMQDRAMRYSLCADRLAKGAAQDGCLYARVVDAYRLPKERAEMRSEAILKALRGAIEEPLALVEMIRELLISARDLVPNCKKSNLSDIENGVHMLLVGARGTLLNVCQNCGKREVFAPLKNRALELGNELESLANDIFAICR